MEAKLLENDKRGGWNQCTVDELRKKVLASSLELSQAVNDRNLSYSVARQAADVANYCMMLADVYKGGGRLPRSK